MALFAVMTADPGGVSGVARGVFDDGFESMGDCIRAGTEIDAWEVEGPPEEQAWEIAYQFLEWFHDLLLDGTVGYDRVWLVFESFQLRQRNVELSPVEVRAGVRTLFLKPDWMGGVAGFDPRMMREQTASAAKGFATSERLKIWGLYRYGRGSDHKRDALRHLALAVKNLAY